MIVIKAQLFKSKAGDSAIYATTQDLGGGKYLRHITKEPFGGVEYEEVNADSLTDYSWSALRLRDYL